MGLNDEACSCISADSPRGCQGVHLHYCEEKSRFCLTGCDYCRNSCPCPSDRKTRSGLKR